GDPQDLVAASAALGVADDQLLKWSRTQRIWPALAVEQLSRSVIAQVVQEHQSISLRRQLANLSQHLMQTFEELNLLHRINEHLSLSGDERRLSEMALQWLHEVLPTECLIARFQGRGQGPGHEWTIVGDSPLEPDELDDFLRSLGPEVEETCLVLDSQTTSLLNWEYSAVREVLSVP